MMSFLIFIFLIGIDTAAGSNVLTTVLGLGETKLDADVITTAMTVAGIVQGSLLMFVPNLSLKMYGTKDETLYSRFHAEGTGAAVLTFGVACLCLFMMNLTVTKTMGFASLVWVTEHILCLLKHYPSKMGVSPGGHIFWLLYSLISIHACFVSAAYTQQLLFAGHLLFALTNVLGLIKPKMLGKIYGFQEMKLNDDEKEWLKGFCYENLAMCVFGMFLLAGVEAHKSLGFGSVVVVAHSAHSLVGRYSSNHLGVLGSSLMFFWMIFHASCAATFISTEVGYLMASIIVAVTALKITGVPSNFEFPQLASEELTK
jgi:hypothetical protein